MTALVHRLQSAALKPAGDLSDLLRLALLVARKLDAADFDAWITNELEGYRPPHTIPPYRRVRGTLKAWNPYQGWIPVLFQSSKVADAYSVRSLGQSAGQLEALLRRNEKGTSITLDLPAEAAYKLQQQMEGPPLEVALHLDASVISSILESVKTRILDWALRLEKANVLGEGLSFSGDEKVRAVEAMATASYHAQHMTVVHRMEQSQIQQASPGATQTYNRGVDMAQALEAVVAIRAEIDELPLSSAQRGQLEAQLTTIEAQGKAPEPAPGIVKEALASTRKILESSAGGLTASQLPAILQKVAGLLG